MLPLATNLNIYIQCDILNTIILSMLINENLKNRYIIYNKMYIINLPIT